MLPYESIGSLPPPHQHNSPWIAIITIVVVLAVVSFFLFMFREYVKNSER